MPMMYLIPAGMSVLGGLMGSEEKTTGKVNPSSQTTNSSHGSVTQHSLDPRMEAAIYGAGGIVPTAQDWYNRNRSGLNQQMVTGLNNQWNQLNASGQGFDAMQNLGMGLMGGGVASNPFTGGGGMEKQDLKYTPAVRDTSSQVTNPFVMPVNTPIPAAAGAPSYGGGGGESGYGSPIGNALSAFAGANGQGGQPTQQYMEDVEGMMIPIGGNAGYSGYRPSNYNQMTWTPSMNVPTTSTAGYGGYGGYSTLPAYSYNGNGGGE